MPIAWILVLCITFTPPLIFLLYMWIIFPRNYWILEKPMFVFTTTILAFVFCGACYMIGLAIIANIPGFHQDILQAFNK